MDEEFHSDSLDLFGDATGSAENLVAEAQKNALRNSFVAVYSPELNASLFFDRECIEIEAERLRTMIGLMTGLREMRAAMMAKAQESSGPERAASQPRAIAPVHADPTLLLMFARLALLTSSQQSSLESRKAGLHYLEENEAHAADLLNPQSMTRIHGSLEAVRASMPSPPPGPNSGIPSQ